MPLYHCTIAEGSTSLEQRSRIAGDVTRIHCETTGAPATFVHTFFVEVPASQLPLGKRAVVLGSIRAGRSPEQKQRLVSALRVALAKALGGAEGEVHVATVDVPARWVMEGGDLLPEPGEEEAWLAKHA